MDGRGCLELDLRLPDLGQVEDEARQLWPGVYARGLVELLGWPAWPIDKHLPLKGLDQPAEARSISDVLFHFLFLVSEAVRPGTQLDHEIGTQRQKLFFFLFREQRQPMSSHPGCVG